MTIAVARPVRDYSARNARDEAILARHRDGDPRAFDDLAREYRSFILKEARSGIRSEDDIDDLIQIGMQALFSVVTDANPKGLPFGARAFQRIRDRISKAKRSLRRRSRWDGVALGHDPDFDLMLSVPARPEPDPADLDEAAFIPRTLDRAMKKLPARERKILVLRYGLDGKGERESPEIGDAIGLSVRRTYELGARARKSLKDILGDDFLNRGDEAPTGAGKETDVGELNGAAVMNGRAPTRPDPETTEVSAPAARPCPKCGGPLKGPTGTRCYKCSPPGKPAAGGKKPKKRHTLKSIDEAGWPPVRKVGPGDPLPIPAEDREALARMLPRLPKNESLVITYRLGLDGHGRRTQEQAGKLIGYGGTAAGKFEGQAVARLLAQGLDISPYLARRPPAADDPEDVLPLPEGFPTGKKRAASPPPAPVKPSAAAVTSTPSGAEAEVRWSMIRLLAGLERDAAARILHDVALAVGVATA